MKSTENNESYLSVFLVCIEILLLIYSIYIVIPIILFAETDGEIYNIERVVKHIHSTARGSYINYNNVTFKYSYKYKVDDVQYWGKNESRMIIHPNLDHQIGKTKVYYNPIFRNISVLYVGDIEYLIYNTLPILVNTVLLIIFRRSKRKEVHKEKEKRGKDQ